MTGRLIWAIVASVVALIGGAGRVQAQVNLQTLVNWCIGKNNPTLEQRLRGCTAAINSGKFKGEVLASGYQNRAITYKEMGKIDEALKDAEQAVRLAPRAPEAHLMLADALFRKGRHDEALNQSNVVITLNPNVTLGYYNRGTMLFSMGQPEKALADFDKAISLDAKYGPAYNNRALTKIALKRYDEALADSTIAIALFKRTDNAATRALPLGTRADIYRAQKKYDLALKDIGAAIAIHPSDQYLRARIAVYEDAGTPEAGLPDIEKLLAKDPNDPLLLNTRCWTNALIGRLETALADCNKAIDIAPTYAFIFDSRALVHLKMGKVDEAVSDYDKALTMMGYEPGGKVVGSLAHHLYGRGLARQKKGDMLGGTVDITQAKTANPEVAEKYQGYLRR